MDCSLQIPVLRHKAVIDHMPRVSIHRLLNAFVSLNSQYVDIK